MNNLRFIVTVPSLSDLVPLGNNNYQLVIKFYDGAGNLLSNPNVPNPYIATVNTQTNSFPVNVPIINATYLIEDVKIKAFSNNDSNCCFGMSEDPYDINNTYNGAPIEDPNIVGAFSVNAAGRNFTFRGSDKFSLDFDEQAGTISDNTAGMTTSGATNQQDGFNVFYMCDGNFFRNEDGSAFKMQNLFLPDGVYTLKKYMMIASKYPNQAAFEVNGADSGYNDIGINKNNGSLAEIKIAIHSVVKPQGSTLAPPWLVIDSKINFTENSPNQDWSAEHKFAGVAWMNRSNQSQALYKQKGVQPYALFGQPQPQEETWNTLKNAQGQVMTEQELFTLGNTYMTGMFGRSKRSIYTSEYIENEQGQGTNSFNRTLAAYKGARASVLEAHPTAKVKETGLHGEYGADDFYGLLSKGIFNASRAHYESYLTDKIYQGYVAGDFMGGNHDFYTNEHWKYRNVNSKYYLHQRKFNFVYEFITLTEKIKLGTKTWQGQDNEVNNLIYTATAIEDLAQDQNGNGIGIGFTLAGDIIPFPEGEMLVRFNTQPAIGVGAAFTIGLWSTLIASGFLNWDAPNSYLGQDPTKMNWNNDIGQPIKWRPNGSNQWQDYIPGVNGAPQMSNTGIHHSLYSSVTDAMIAGRDSLFPIKDKLQGLRFASYTTSNRGGFNPTPGQTGHHLNGHGPVNFGQFTQRDIFEQKKGTALRTDDVVFYINEYLPPNLYEENVTVAGVNMGRIYGGQTQWKLIPGGA